MKVVKEVSEPKSRGGLALQLPLIVRLPDVLKNRLESLQSAFDSAIQSQSYGSHYQGVYPVKCNQDRYMVEDIVEFGSHLLWLHQEEELDLVIEISRKLAVRPVIGMRVKLKTKHAGHFGATSGVKGKFGLNTMQILRVAKNLEQNGMLDCLQLLHFHIGSQIPSSSFIADGVGEATQIYCELVRLGADMRVIDVGGDSQSPDSDNSVGYGLEEYASAVVQSIRNACGRKFVKHTMICSESGRALVSHHSVLIFEAVSASAPVSPTLDSLDLGLHYIADGLTDDSLSDYRNLTAAAVRGDYETCLVYAEQLKQRCVDQFKEGSLSLEHLASIDNISELVSKAIGTSDPVRTYHVNLSVFTSVPDVWGIGQQFPIVPIQRLDEKPVVKGVLSDLTCDSDGKIDRFIGGETSLPLHELEGEGRILGSGGGAGYYLGRLTRRLLEDYTTCSAVPSTVEPYLVLVTEKRLRLSGAVPGLSCREVLRMMQHEPEMMFEPLKHRVEECIHGEDSDDDELDRDTLVRGLARSFHNMPYLANIATAASFYEKSNNDNVGGDYYVDYYPDEDYNKNSVAAVVGEEDEHWTYRVA
ncbi:hypothetical protein MKW98_009198 [Papaver atlanticum]|uniref:Arginine decarboxylase n=1 Tax=Papaver atlanticum TaxID=357466 RepID=A0AAD4T8X5_9MAGN|nr:hypothetical protein MKW98_009198 [Papaver atlanticum]